MMLPTPRRDLSAPVRLLLPTLVLTGIGCSPAHSDVKMPAIFGDHMVLQQGQKLPVWGWADPGEKVTVSFAGKSGQAVAGPDGKWRIDLPPVSANGQGQVLTVTGKNTLTFQDVLAGDVWVASGQSNMEFGIQTADKGAEAIAESNDPQLRLFFVPWATSLDPKADIAAAPADSLNGKWQVCTPSVMKSMWAWHGFSAVGYFFAREIRQKRGVPIGMIATYKGGTPAEAWTSVSGLQKNPALDDMVDAHQKLVDNLAQNQQLFARQSVAYQAAMKRWNTDVAPTFNAAMAQWKTDFAQAKAAGQAPPPMPRPSQPIPQEPRPADGGYGAPGNLFNGMIAPIIPYGIKGVIWYQGESNGDYFSEATTYSTLFPTLINDWREKWGQGDFPFLYVQLANFIASKRDPLGGVWPWVREGQADALSLPATGMATAIDIGDPDNIHPLDKQDVGKRLALVARRVAYGESIVSGGPVYDTMRVEGNKIRVAFKSPDGLTIGTPPWTPSGAVPTPSSKLTGFSIAGADQNFVPADAVIAGNSVVVTSATVTQPAAVRYDWADNPGGNLYNKTGLPAFPFRTDHWEPAPATNLAIVPNSNGQAWDTRFQKNVADSKGKQIDLIFDGDSITDWFQVKGKDVWAKHYGTRNAYDFGIAGDQTNNILYRLDHGQVDGLDPKLIVLLIGTNNTIRDSSGQIVDGIKACVAGYLQRCPHAHLLLLAVFPRRTPKDPLRLKIDKINPVLARTNFGDRVTYLDIGKIFLNPDGTIRTDLMPGLLHPSAEGYEAWANAIEPVVSRYVPNTTALSR